MVVTRRAPVVPPPPPLARNLSLHGTQRPPRTSLSTDPSGVSKGATPSVAAASSDGSSAGHADHHNGPDSTSGKKNKKSKRRTKNKYQKSNFQAFLDFLTKLLLLAFTIYTFSVCPQDTHLQSPICRGLAEYRRIVLDPYIIPPIQAAFAHPSVAPHIKRAKPYVRRAVEITAPIFLRTQQGWNLHVVPQWEKRIVPEWNRRIIPMWNEYIIPQWDKYVAPRIQVIRSGVEPYRLFVMQRYAEYIAPWAQVTFSNLQRRRRQAEPYVLLAASRTKNGYNAAKRCTIPLAKKSGRLLQQFALLLRKQRQKFVDPHVAKIWEKVKELSSGQVIREATSEHASSVSETTHAVLDTLGYETSVSPTQSLALAYDVTPIPKETDVADISSVSGYDTTKLELYPTPAESIFVPVIAPTGTEDMVTSSCSVGARTSDAGFTAEAGSASKKHSPAGTPSSGADLPGTRSASSLRLPAVSDLGGAPAPVTQSKIVVPAASTTVPPASSLADDDIDLDAFYAELGLDEPLSNSGSSKEHNSVPPGPPTETEDEKAERLRRKAEETARKRADVEARQAKWEAELDAQMVRSTSQLQNRLGNLRMMAAAELASSAEVRSSIEELVRETEKYIKGAEIYLKNLKGENRRLDEKLAHWDRVAGRVNDKFMERLSATEDVLNAWHGTVLDKELEEVATVTAEVREIAEKGQLDLGLDYAWLEDVTYNDWQRYHALIGASERYADEIASIQNGTHPSVVVTNPMDSILADLTSEIQDVVIGFETRLRRIKRDGERTFNNHDGGVAQKEEEKGSIVGPDSEVSILPVPREQGSIPAVVIRRSQEQVLEALGKVEPAVEVEHLVGGSNVEAGHLFQKTDGGAGIDHTEL